MIKKKRDIRKQADFMAFYVSKEDSWMMPEQCYQLHWWFVLTLSLPIFLQTQTISLLSLPTHQNATVVGSHYLSTFHCFRYLTTTNQGAVVFAAHNASISVTMSTSWAIKHIKIIFIASFLHFRDNCFVFLVFLNSLFSVSLA